MGKKKDEFDEPYTTEEADVINKPLGGMEECPEKGCTANIRKGFFYRKVDEGDMKEVTYLEYHLEKDHGISKKEE